MPRLQTEPLRALTVAGHPRGVPHLAAASGLVCIAGRAYVIGDDEHHLAEFSDAGSPGVLHRLIDGELPHGRAARKRRKPDLETLLHLDASMRHGPALVALGSGSAPNRCRGWLIGLTHHGTPAGPARAFDIAPLVRVLQGALGAVNIEGAFTNDGDFMLLNRGDRAGRGNAAVRLPLAALHQLIDGRAGLMEAPHIQPIALGTIDGVHLGFTDGAALPDGRWAFSAVAEDSADAVADGPLRGAVVGTVSPGGRVQACRRLDPPHKIEGIAVRRDRSGLSICMVSDADDPMACAWLLRARL